MTTPADTAACLLLAADTLDSNPERWTRHTMLDDRPTRATHGCALGMATVAAYVLGHDIEGVAAMVSLTHRHMTLDQDDEAQTLFAFNDMQARDAHQVAARLRRLAGYLTRLPSTVPA